MTDRRLPRRTFLAGLTPLFPLAVLTPWPPLPLAALGASSSGEGELTTSPLSGTERGSGGEDPTGGQGVRTGDSQGVTLKLGVASYSLRKFSRERAVEMVKALGTPYINLKSVHLPYELSPEQLAAARREIEAAGLQIVGGGTITFDQDTDEGVRKYFAYAKAAGMPRIVATADPAILPRIERFVREYDIEVAIHNHGPEDKRFPSPYDALKHVRNMDRRMGLCIDIGHTVRAGTDVVRAIADAGPRLLDMHAKDLRDLKVKESQCIVGEGAMPIAEIFQQLQAIRYRGYVNLEYEIDADDPLTGMQRSFAYMRGVLAGLSATTA
jgi:sugar phosphate isomerase/epimerase